MKIARGEIVAYKITNCDSGRTTVQINATEDTSSFTVTVPSRSYDCPIQFEAGTRLRYNNSVRYNDRLTPAAVVIPADATSELLVLHDCSWRWLTKGFDASVNIISVSAYIQFHVLRPSTTNWRHSGPAACFWFLVKLLQNGPVCQSCSCFLALITTHSRSCNLCIRTTYIQCRHRLIFTALAAGCLQWCFKWAIK